ncbi:MAG: NADH-quinone oxidoreductase subunit A [Candidatus Eisenbacteria bacterium]|nr:NADH-quinone oxidoreductase subunit A [Candidatus Eisenbacteria bacterium]
MAVAHDYFPILVFSLILLAFAIICIIFARFLGPRRVTQAKLSPYECGLDPVGDTRGRISVKFYITALLFIILDVEVVFFYPWALVFRKVAPFAFWEMLFFAFVLIVGYLYALRRRGLEWSEPF